MTAEEIRERVSMFDLAKDYGIKIDRHGMCSCPFHGADKHPSMKLYRDGYKCFACGAAGDIFKFVQNMDECSFKEAFLKLGGTYEREPNRAAEAIRRANLAARIAEQERAIEAEIKFKYTLVRTITLCQCIKDAYEPLSDEWCLAADRLEHLLYSFERLLNGEEVNKIDVLRECERLRRRYASLSRPLSGAIQDRK